jgi:tetratricopeptide (TPR) repeat protein
MIPAPKPPTAPHRHTRRRPTRTSHTEHWPKPLASRPSNPTTAPNEHDQTRIDDASEADSLISGLAHRLDPEDQRRAAIHRILDHYLHSAYTADQLLSQRRSRATLPPAEPGTTPEDPVDEGRALAWFEAERPALLAAIAQATAEGFDTHVRQLPGSLGIFFDRQGHWRDWATTQRAALTIARRTNDSAGQARAHRAIGQALVRIGSHDEARGHLQSALDLFQGPADHADQARTHLVLAVLSERQARYRDALSHAQQALDLHRAAGHRSGQADALNGVGWYHAHLGNLQQALACCQEALALTLELGYRRGEAATRDSLGYVYHRRDQHPQAITSYQQAVTLYRELGDRYAEATTLTRMGDTHHAAGDPPAASAAWQQALTILDQLDHPDADQVRTKLAALDTPIAAADPPERAK